MANQGQKDGGVGAAATIDALASVLREARLEVTRQLRRHPKRAGRTLVGEAEDLTQTALLGMLESGALRPCDSPRASAAFVRVVVRRVVWRTLSGGRGNPWATIPVPNEELDTIETASTNVDQTVDAVAALRRLLDGLSDRGRRLLRRFFFEGAPLEQIASSEGLSRAAAYAWRLRTRRRLASVSDPSLA